MQTCPITLLGIEVGKGGESILGLGLLDLLGYR